MVNENMAKLTAKQIDSSLKELPAWSSTGDAIQRTVQFANFVQADGHRSGQWAQQFLDTDFHGVDVGHTFEQ